MMDRTDELFTALEEFDDIPYVKYIKQQILEYPGTLHFQNCIFPNDPMPNYMMLIDDNSPMGRFNNAKYQAVNHKCVIVGTTYFDMIVHIYDNKNIFPFYQCRLALDSEIPKWMPNHRNAKRGDTVFVVGRGEHTVEHIDKRNPKYNLTAVNKEGCRVHFSVTGHATYEDSKAIVFKCEEDAIEYDYYYEQSLYCV